MARRPQRPSSSAVDAIETSEPPDAAHDEPGHEDARTDEGGEQPGSPIHAPSLSTGARTRHVASDRSRDFALHHEEVANRAVVRVRPQMLVGGCVDELRGHAHAIAGPCDGAFEEPSNVELPRD